ncbi:hypothetical protein ACS0TY_002417 [Phlomoides rotata]
MKQVLLISWLVLVVVLIPIMYAKCEFEGMFMFGDSNSDTGGYYAAFPSQPPPNGMTYFGRPTGRSGDGRLYIDYLAQALGFPFLSPYLQSIGSDFRQGVNFAVSASPVIQPNTSVFITGVSPFYLDVQINQMKHFKAKVDEYESPGTTTLPKPDIFRKALYTIWIGQHDVAYGIADLGTRFVPNEPQIAAAIVNAIKELHRLGGRTFLVMNLAPIGCYGAVLTQVSHNRSDVDSAGCMVSFNNIVRGYNSVLKESLNRARKDLKDANVIYADTHSLILELYQKPKSHGFQHGVKACCGYGGGVYNFRPDIFCGNSKEIKGHKITATAYACEDPHNYVSWDGIHLTENANKILANAILNGSYFDPPFNLKQHCDIHHIG